MKKKDKELDAEKERDRLACERKEKKKVRRLMKKVNRLMGEAGEEVKDGGKD